MCGVWRADDKGIILTEQQITIALLWDRIILLQIGNGLWAGGITLMTEKRGPFGIFAWVKARAKFISCAICRLGWLSFAFSAAAGGGVMVADTEYGFRVALLILVMTPIAWPVGGMMGAMAGILWDLE